jgi:hypothetical protein
MHTPAQPCSPAACNTYTHEILTWLPSHTLVLCDLRFGAQLLFDFHPTPMFCVGVHWELTTLVTKVVTTYLVVTTFKGL